MSPQANEPAATVRFRKATAADLPAILRLLADDPLGKFREDGTESAAMRAAFDVIDADSRNQLIVMEADGRVEGCLQLTFIPGLTYKGRDRGQIEAVRVSNAMRGKGLGKALINHAVELARQHGCALVQLTTDKRRAEAQAFYKSLGFTASHEGMKLWL